MNTILTKGQKKSSNATCKCEKTGNFEVRVNKVPLSNCQDQILVGKINEVLEVITPELLEGLEFDIAFNSNKKDNRKGGRTGTVYAARQALCRAVLSYFGTYSDEYIKQEIQAALMAFDRFCLVTDTRSKEAKKYGGPGARARYQKSYR